MAEDLNPEDYMSNAEIENQQLKMEKLRLAGALTSQGFSPEDELNLIQYQLETDKILERIEHFLKGDQIRFTEQGSYFDAPTKNVLAKLKRDPKTKITYYIQEVKDSTQGSEVKNNVLVKILNKNSEAIDVMERDSDIILEKLKSVKLQDLGYKYVEVLDDEKRPLNEYGVAEMMRIISMYVTKETFLSYYDEDRINEIMADLGDALNNFLYPNYEKLGMDSKFKESKYIIMVLNIVHTIESCYRRALYGAEQKNIKTRSIVTENNGGGSNRAAMGMAQGARRSEKWSPLKPRTW